MSIPSPRGMMSRDSQGTRWGTSGNFVGGLIVRGEPSAAFFNNSQNLASSPCRLRPIATGNIAEQREGVTHEPLDYIKYPLHTLSGRFRLGTFCIVQEALVPQIWWKTRGMRSGTCVSISSQTHVLPQDVYNCNVCIKEGKVGNSVDVLLTS